MRDLLRLFRVSSFLTVGLGRSGFATPPRAKEFGDRTASTAAAARSAARRSLRLCGAVVLLAPTATLAAGSSDGPVKFTTHRVGNYRSEACAVGDFNNDGKLDIIAGPYLYLAPDWKRVEIRRLAGEVDEQGKGYID